MRKLIFLIFLITLFSGCATKKNVPLAKPETLVDQSLRDAAESITRDLAVLTGSRQNRDYGSPAGSGDLYSAISLNWDGPMEGALSDVASKVGFKFLIEGKERPTPLLVHVRLIDRPAIMVIREIGAQTGPGEGVLVDESARTLRLIYEEKRS